MKNLQHGTKLQDLESLFSPFGHLGKVVLPPSGVTALVQFEKLSSASKAFEKIAYTKVRLNEFNPTNFIFFFFGIFTIVLPVLTTE